MTGFGMSVLIIVVSVMFVIIANIDSHGGGKA
jgi:hypothetical protein